MMPSLVSYETNVITMYWFTKEEIRALARLLEKEWIPREDDEVNAVVNRIFTIVRELDNELDRPNSPPA
jgi:hypothetical protein